MQTLCKSLFQYKQTDGRKIKNILKKSVSTKTSAHSAMQLSPCRDMPVLSARLQKGPFSTKTYVHVYTFQDLLSRECKRLKRTWISAAQTHYIVYKWEVFLSLSAMVD